MSERHQEAADTRENAAVEYHIRPQDKQMIGTTDWYVVRNKRGQITVRREQDIKPTDIKLCGPYFTKDQARCESHGC